MPALLLAALFATLALLAAPAIAQAPTPAPSTASAAPAATSTPIPALVVRMKNFVFTPNPAVIKVGDTIQFLNDDATAHTVAADDKSWDSGNMDINATYSHTFTTAGTFTYNCAYHGFMRGTITVK